MAEAGDSPLLLWPLTGGQIAFFIGFAVTVLLWLHSEILRRTAPRRGSAAGVACPSTSLDGSSAVLSDSERRSEGERRRSPDQRTPNAGMAPAPSPALGAGPVVGDAEVGSTGVQTAPLLPLISADNPVVHVLSLNTQALLHHRETLRAMSEFGLHLCWYFVCDRTSLLHESGNKWYDRDLFWFLYLILVCYCVATSLHPNKVSAYLNREQTEEWKGWMQVLFLMYHYFNAAEQYNAIRIYIAAYVWMTGFGNFSFYYIRKDFSAGRFFQMIWRLNFMVFWACVVLANDYMCYYICGMHTLWTFFVYFSLMFFKEHNEKNWVIALKFAGCTAIVCGLFYSREIWETAWAPLRPLVVYVNPRAKPGTPGADPMHEWYFRAGLDRYVWMFGMLCANLHPRTSAFLESLEGIPSAPARVLAHGAVLAALLAIGYAWYAKFFVMDKFEYNVWHPYTSWIPIMVYMLLRNLTPTLRSYSLHFFGFLGKITLETYIGQYHIWMSTGMPNGQPKNLLTLIPKYPLLNFGLTTALYIFVSLRIFELTNQLKTAFLPSKDDRRLYRNLILVVITWLLLYGLGRGLRAAVPPEPQHS
eukprot:TRINITY_DN1133_c0_g1_i1.p1 TRINITY_DN1133_c0_g1~~TRINITY_DN1133_c0_g1_i1.p1  ORF type:complete len:615 (+),score=206.52 TRINITY_DN1133_c0_g1_i1:86-1846(+)